MGRRRPRLIEVLNAIPPGCKVLRGRQVRRLYGDIVAHELEDQGVRCDARANALAIAAELAEHADYQDGTTWHSRAARCERAGVSASTWKVHRKWLEDRRLLRLVTPGRKYWHGEQSRSDAAVYVLICPKWLFRKIAARHRRFPRWPRSRPPTVSPQPSTPDCRGAGPSGDKGQIGPPFGRTHPRGGPRNPELARRAGAGRAMAEVLRQTAGQFVTDGWCGHLMRPFLRAGWRPRDLAEALAAPPGGRSWDFRGHELAAAGLAGRAEILLGFRLSAWLGPDGLPKASPSARREAARLAEQTRFQAGQAELELGAAADPRGHVEAILAQLGWHRPPPRPGKRTVTLCSAGPAWRQPFPDPN